MKLTKSKLKEMIREELINEYDRGLTPNDLMKELKKVNMDVVKILNKYNQSLGYGMPAVIQKWMFGLHKDIKKAGYEV
jgi:spermidine/putrescine-binding protein